MALSNRDFLELNISLFTQNVNVQGIGVGLFTSVDATLGTNANKYETFDTFGQVEEVFDSSSAPFIALEKWFNQNPIPKSIIVARFLLANVAAVLESAVNTKTVSEFVAITDTAAFNLVVDSVLQEDIHPDFTTVTSFADVATAINAASLGITTTFDATSGRFNIVSDTTGASSTLSFGLPPTTIAFVDLSAFMGLTEADGAILNQGANADTNVQGSLDIINGAPPSDLVMFDNTLLFSTFSRQDEIDISSALEAQRETNFKMTFWGDDDLANLLPNETDVLGFDLKTLELQTPAVVFSALQDYKHVAAPAYLSSINFDADNGLRGMKFARLVDTTPDTFDQTGKQTLDTNKVNYYAEFAAAPFYAQGVQPAPNLFSDSVFALYGWFVPTVNDEIFNLLSSRLVGNDVNGQAAVQGVIANVANRAIANGFIIDGATASVVPVSATMKADIIATTGNSNFSGFLPSIGYLLFATPLTQQTQQQRDERELPPYFLWAKFKGFVAKVILNANFEN